MGKDGIVKGPYRRAAVPGSIRRETVTLAGLWREAKDGRLTAVGQYTGLQDREGRPVYERCRKGKRRAKKIAARFLRRSIYYAIASEKSQMNENFSKNRCLRLGKLLSYVDYGC
jgi:hypothetical protein